MSENNVAAPHAYLTARKFLGHRDAQANAIAEIPSETRSDAKTVYSNF